MAITKIKLPNNTTLDIKDGRLPDTTSSDNGKILQVVSGSWSAVTPVTVYTGSASPNNNIGNNGDIYIQSSSS